jgi:hypothetical protein
MSRSRRDTLAALLVTPLFAPAAVAYANEQDTPNNTHLGLPSSTDEDKRLPNGKSQHDEIARQQHADALKDVESLVAASQELRDELKRAGDFVVPVASVRKTEEIEKLARKIRGRLKS